MAFAFGLSKMPKSIRLKIFGHVEGFVEIIKMPNMYATTISSSSSITDTRTNIDKTNCVNLGSMLKKE